MPSMRIGCQSWRSGPVWLALAACGSGDVLIVWKLDRLGQSLPDLVGLSETLKSRDIGLKVLTGAAAAIDTTTPEGRLFFGMFAVIAEFERDLIRERTKSGMSAARRRGKRVGCPPSLTPEKLDPARRLVGEGKGRAIVVRMLGSVLRLCGGAERGIEPSKK